MLQSKKAVSINELMRKYEVGKRTIYRDLRLLQEAGLPIYKDDDGRYRLMEGYYLPPMMITMEEAMALLLSEKLVKKYADKSFEQHFSSLAAKIKSVLRYSDKEYLDRLDKHTRVYHPPMSELGYSHADGLIALQQAINDRRVTEISYVNVNKEPSTRKIEPIGITQYGLGWHLVAWCRKRNEYRDFRLDRIRQYKVLDEQFTWRHEDPLQYYILQLQKNL